MALTPQQQNFYADLIQSSLEAITLANKFTDLDARYSIDQMSTVQNADLIAYAPTSHLTQDKVFGSITAIEALLTALGQAKNAGDNLGRFTIMKG